MHYSFSVRAISYGAGICALFLALPVFTNAQESPVIMRSIDPRFGISPVDNWENPPFVPDGSDNFNTLDPDSDPFNTIEPDQWTNPPIVPEDSDIFGTTEADPDTFNTVMPDQWANPPQIMSSGDDTIGLGGDITRTANDDASIANEDDAVMQNRGQDTREDSLRTERARPRFF